MSSLPSHLVEGGSITAAAVSHGKRSNGGGSYGLLAIATLDLDLHGGRLKLDAIRSTVMELSEDSPDAFRALKASLNEFFAEKEITQLFVRKGAKTGPKISVPLALKLEFWVFRSPVFHPQYLHAAAITNWSGNRAIEVPDWKGGSANHHKVKTLALKTAGYAMLRDRRGK